MARRVSDTAADPQPHGTPPMDADGRSRPGLVVDRVRMEFDGKVVLGDVSMDFSPGEIHALIGHNGSGKSTLVRILAGYHRPVAGECRLDGETLTAGSPPAARRMGLRFVHQDLGLVAQFTPVENFGIGGEYPRTRWHTIDWPEQRRRMREVFDLLGCPVPADRAVSELSAVECSMIAIARAIGAAPERSGARFVVFDEPTATLEASDAEQLFGVVRRLVGAGIGTLFISHQLNDVLGLCSDVTVLRDGRVVDTFQTTTSTRSSLVEAMLGESTAEAESRIQARSRGATELDPDAAASLSARSLRCETLHGVDLDIAPGECVCAVGLAGSGREELVYAMAGAIPCGADRMAVGGREVSGMSPARARDLGVALVPGNRLPGSLVDDFAMRENLTFAAMDGVSRGFGYVDRRRERVAAQHWVERFDIRPDDVEYRSRYLSGGNKQKLIMAKWLSIAPSTMLIDEPTAGVDVGAVMTILQTLRAFVADGGALLVSTSELDDALALADRVVVFNDGRITHQLVRGRDELSEQSILLAMVQDSSADQPAHTTPARGDV